MSYTYTILDLSRAAYEEIRQKLLEADYTVQWNKDGREIIDMHGIAVAEEPGANETSQG